MVGIFLRFVVGVCVHAYVRACVCACVCVCVSVSLSLSLCVCVWVVGSVGSLLYKDLAARAPCWPSHMFSSVSALTDLGSACMVQSSATWLQMHKILLYEYSSDI